MRSSVVWVCLCFSVTLSANANEPTEPHTSIRFNEPNLRNGSSLAVAVTNSSLVHTAQILPKPVSIQLDGIDVLQTQTKSCLQELDRVLHEAGSSLSNIVKLNIYVALDRDVVEIEANLLRQLPKGTRPAVCFVRTSLPRGDVRIALDAVAVATQSTANVKRWLRQGDVDLNTTKDLITIGRTAAAILPNGPRVYISGQAEIGDGTLRDATFRTMLSLKKSLEHLGLQSADVVQLKAFLRPMSDAATAIEVISETFPDSIPPPIVLVEWDSPQAPIEIELIAASRVVAQSAEAPSVEFLTLPDLKPSPVFARAVRLNHPTTIYISGLYGSTGNPNSAEEVRDLFGTLKRVATANGSDMTHLAKATYYVSTDEVSRQLNAIRPESYDPERPPAASKAKISGTGRAGRTIVLDMIAVPTRP